MLYARTLSGRESGAETDIYRQCRTQTIDAGTPTYAPTISFVAVSVVRIVNLLRQYRRLVKPRTDIAPDRGVRGKGIHKQHETSYEEPGV